MPTNCDTKLLIIGSKVSLVHNSWNQILHICTQLQECETTPETNTKEENDKQANKQEESSQFVG